LFVCLRMLPTTPQNNTPHVHVHPDKIEKRVLQIQKSQSTLGTKLKELKKKDILKHCLYPSDEMSDFEIYEFYGDSVLYERLAFTLLKTKRFMSPGLLTEFRSCSLTNKNLCTVFDLLNLGEVVSLPRTEYSIKLKADAIEAMIGELTLLALDGEDPIIQHTLDELIGFICFMGEQEFYLELGKKQKYTEQLQQLQLINNPRHTSNTSPIGRGREPTLTRPLREVHSITDEMMPPF